MLQFRQSDTEAILIVTLKERATISDPYYLFIFTHILTKQTVAFVKVPGSDTSSFPDRYNAFAINPSVTFATAPIGQYNYVVYEQGNDANLLPNDTPIEWGKLLLDWAVDYAPILYNEPTSYKAYNG